jgi:hypothetical protein
MNITMDKVNEFFKNLGFDLPENPERALEFSINAIEKNPSLKGKVFNVVQELRKKLNESGGDWEKIKGWLSSLFPSKKMQPVEAGVPPEQEPVHSKFVMIPSGIDALKSTGDLGQDILMKTLYGLLSSATKNTEVLKEYEDILKTRLGKQNKKLAAFLDKIADRLESKGLLKEAFEIDKISDLIEEI